MTARTSRSQPQPDMFPGMPDNLGKKPPKATDESWKSRTLDEAMQRSYEVMDRAIIQFTTGDVLVEITKGKQKGHFRNHGPRELAGIVGLYSGGRDSVNAMHFLRKYMKDRGLFRHHFRGIAHVNTGTAVPETTKHVREAVPAWGMKLLELAPRTSYLDLVRGRVLATTGPNAGRPVWRGFPGPGGGQKNVKPHAVMYRRLKDEPLQRLRGAFVGREGIRKKVMFIGGMRWDESDNRFRTAEEIDVEKGIVWVSPLVHWTDAHMREYRTRYRCEKVHKHQPHRMCGDEALPVNEVADNLCMSGDCACGAYAGPDEKEQRTFFYPDHGAEINYWERTVRDDGIAAWRWGKRPPKGFQQTPGGAATAPVSERLCRNCQPPQTGDDLTDYWLDKGLITPAHHTTFARNAEAS